ncbi:hypothetical protein AUJ68_01580 [Candidatus Woesearchaeota archaeon CG1_02_57_44]|nr:MAG: hypothetical protein AUJ68_01580 [Candidatus Woesearchaeota archaeon CG1_02_57_44]
MMEEDDKNIDVPEGQRLIQFSGRECVHCKEMDPIVEQLQKDTGLRITHLECWHDEKNLALFEKYDQGRCQGVPFFYNEKTTKWICGNCDYDALKKWAMGE